MTHVAVLVGDRRDRQFRIPALVPPPAELEVQDKELVPEGFSLLAMGSRVKVIGEDDSGIPYGCLELASRVRDLGGLLNKLAVTDRPAFKLRGTCIGMQKPYCFGAVRYTSTRTPRSGSPRQGVLA